MRSRGVVVSTLGITQTIAWGSTYYLTAVFTDPVAADLHISRLGLVLDQGGPLAALLLSGLCTGLSFAALLGLRASAQIARAA